MSAKSNEGVLPNILFTKSLSDNKDDICVLFFTFNSTIRSDSSYNSTEYGQCIMIAHQSVSISMDLLGIPVIHGRHAQHGED